MREARGPAWTDWLAEHGVVALDGIDTRSLVLHLRDGGRDARGRRRRRGARSTRRSSAVARAAADGRPRARRGRLDARAVRLRRRGPRRGSRSSTTAASARSSRRLAAGGRRGHRLPARRRRRRARAASTACCSRTGPGDPEPLVEEIATVARAARPRAGASASASATSCSRSPTGHETFKLPFGHRGANHPVLERRTGRVLVTSQNHGFAVAPTRRRARRRTSRSTTAPSRASTSPSCARARCSSTPRPARARTTRWPLLDALGRGGGACRRRR